MTSRTVAVNRCSALFATALTLASVFPLEGQALAYTRSVRYIYDHTNKKAPAWSGGTLVAVENNLTSAPSIHLFDRQGQESSVPITIPGAVLIDIMGEAHGVDGATALCGYINDAKSRQAGFIAIAADTGSDIKIFRTYPYIPQLVTVAPDGTYWAVGIENVGGTELRSPTNDRGVVRHFNKEGVQVEAFIPRSAIRHRADLFGMPGYLAASLDRVGWYRNFGEDYVEISLDGGIDVYPGVAVRESKGFATGFALTEKNDAFVSVQADSIGLRKVYRLDRVQRTWVPIDLPDDSESSVLPRLLGADRNALVFPGKSEGVMKFLTVVK